MANKSQITNYSEKQQQKTFKKNKNNKKQNKFVQKARNELRYLLRKPKILNNTKHKLQIDWGNLY